MAKHVFRYNEIEVKEGELLLKLNREFGSPEKDEEEVEPEYTGPTAEDLKREADEFKAKWEQEKAQMLVEAQAKADEIIKNAEEAGFEQVKRQSDQAAIIKNEAQNEADRIVREAQSQAQEILAKAHEEEAQVRETARQEGYEQGNKDGFADGNAEAQRLVDRLHVMLEAVQAKRQDILDGTEQQIVDLVLLMTRKVVKVMSDSQKSVITSNVIQALKKVKGRGEVILRVNLKDVQLATEHTKDFIREVENIQNITVMEDSSVEKGGCIVETDFGAIDARISSQLGELEAKILELSPIKTVEKNEIVNPDL